MFYLRWDVKTPNKVPIVRNSKIIMRCYDFHEVMISGSNRVCTITTMSPNYFITRIYIQSGHGIYNLSISVIEILLNIIHPPR